MSTIEFYFLRFNIYGETLAGAGFVFFNKVLGYTINFIKKSYRTMKNILTFILSLLFCNNIFSEVNGGGTATQAHLTVRNISKNHFVENQIDSFSIKISFE